MGFGIKVTKNRIGKDFSLVKSLPAGFVVHGNTFFSFLVAKTNSNGYIEKLRHNHIIHDVVYVGRLK